MPLVEEQVGKSLASLVERNVSELKDILDWKEVNAEQGHWLLKAIFWLLSGKILHDKDVDRFENVNPQNIEDLFRRVAKHYGSAPLRIESRKLLDALQGPARDIDRFSSLALTTTESLAYVYENALISQETRSSLGTHTTPSFLVDYIVGGLTDWIEEIPISERTVFEPACGHAAFLVSAMRLLTEMLPARGLYQVGAGSTYEVGCMGLTSILLPLS
jgi:type I restriction-modification system DNA methylase subunit